MRRSRNNETLHYGFVHMETSEDAHRAIQSLNGQKFLGRRLRYNLFLLSNFFALETHENDTFSQIELGQQLDE